MSLACPALVASSFRLLFPPSLMPDQPNSNRGLGAFLFFIYLSVNLGALLLAAQSQRQPRSYLNSTAVTLSEILKLLTSIAAIRASAPSARAALATVVRVVFRMPDQMLRVAMPALLYTIQNNIIYAALSHVDAVTFQITYQLKIVASLLASRILLKKKASVMRWISTLLLTFGVILVQLSLRLTAQVFAPGEIAPQGYMYIVHRGVALYGGKVFGAGESPWVRAACSGAWLLMLRRAGFVHSPSPCPPPAHHLAFSPHPPPCLLSSPSTLRSPPSVSALPLALPGRVWGEDMILTSKSLQKTYCARAMIFLSVFSLSVSTRVFWGSNYLPSALPPP